MTIDEAIKHCEEMAHQNEILMKRYDAASGYSRSHNEQIRTSGAIGCEQLISLYRQLAEWLMELKNYQMARKEINQEIINWNDIDNGKVRGLFLAESIIAHYIDGGNRELIRNKTNGDVIMAMFPNCRPCIGMNMVDTDIAVFEIEWWNAPYTK